MNHYLRHILVFIFFFCIATAKSLAQAIPINDSTSYHNLSFNIKGGINQAPVVRFTPSFTVGNGLQAVQHKLCDINTTLGYQFSIGWEYHINKRFSIRTSLGYLRNNLRADYQERKIDETTFEYFFEKGIFEEDQVHFKIPVIIGYSFGKKINWQLGTGIYWLPTRGLFGNLISYPVREGQTSPCEQSFIPEDHQEGNDFLLLWEVNNFGAIFHARMSIPIKWNVEILIESQYLQQLNALPPPSISRPQFLFETGFRFRLKYDYHE